MQGAAWLLGDERGRTFAVEAPSYDKRNQLVTGARLLGLGCDLQIVNDGPAFQATKPGGLLSIFRTYAVDESLWRQAGDGAAVVVFGSSWELCIKTSASRKTIMGCFFIEEG
ncbi:MAG: hypothetical protein ABW047_06760 [Nitrospiraceae bacterium]